MTLPPNHQRRNRACPAGTVSAALGLAPHAKPREAPWGLKTSGRPELATRGHGETHPSRSGLLRSGRGMAVSLGPGHAPSSGPTTDGSWYPGSHWADRVRLEYELSQLLTVL